MAGKVRGCVCHVRHVVQNARLHQVAFPGYVRGQWLVRYVVRNTRLRHGYGG